MAVKKSVKQSQVSSGRVSTKVLVIICLLIVLGAAAWVYLNNRSSESEPAVDETQLVPQESLPGTGPTELQPL